MGLADAHRASRRSSRCASTCSAGLRASSTSMSSARSPATPGSRATPCSTSDGGATTGCGRGGHAGCCTSGTTTRPPRSWPASTTTTTVPPRCASRSSTRHEVAGAGDGAARLLAHELARVRAQALRALAVAGDTEHVWLVEDAARRPAPRRTAPGRARASGPGRRGWTGSASGWRAGRSLLVGEASVDAARPVLSTSAPSGRLAGSRRRSRSAAISACSSSETSISRKTLLGSECRPRSHRRGCSACQASSVGKVASVLSTSDPSGRLAGSRRRRRSCSTSSRSDASVLVGVVRVARAVVGVGLLRWGLGHAHARGPVWSGSHPTTGAGRSPHPPRRSGGRPAGSAAQASMCDMSP